MIIPAFAEQKYMMSPRNIENDFLTQIVNNPLTVFCTSQIVNKLLTI